MVQESGISWCGAGCITLLDGVSRGESDISSSGQILTPAEPDEEFSFTKTHLALVRS